MISIKGEFRETGRRRFGDERQAAPEDHRAPNVCAMKSWLDDQNRSTDHLSSPEKRKLHKLQAPPDRSIGIRRTKLRPEYFPTET
jgi:hypothetical protein